MTTEDLQRQIAELANQVQILTAESAARKLLGRYMFLCDAPLPEHGMTEQQRGAAIGALFTADAIWEGAGGAHGAQFGRQIGPAEIAAHMTTFFTGREPALIFNVHYLCTECLVASADAAEGTWVQFQPWVHEDGSSVLRSSRLHVRFRHTDSGWRIAHYRTENLFIAGLPEGWASTLIERSVLLESAAPRLEGLGP